MARSPATPLAKNGPAVPLTPKQKAVLAFIIQFTAGHEFPPTTRDISRRFKIKPSPALQQLQTLERKGYIVRLPNVARGIRVLRRPDGTPV